MQPPGAVVAQCRRGQTRRYLRGRGPPFERLAAAQGAQREPSLHRRLSPRTGSSAGGLHHWSLRLRAAAPPAGPRNPHTRRA
eukprot:164556-Alexandrium_andersonii.AAC.1